MLYQDYDDVGEDGLPGESLTAALMKAFVRWLRTPIRQTHSQIVAERSRWQWSKDGEDRFTVSRLGIINGYTTLIGVVLVACWDDFNSEPLPPYLALRRKWW